MNEKTTPENESIRDLLFPAMGLQIITGFNFYDEKEMRMLDKNSRKLFYLHHALDEEDQHFCDIRNCIEKHCDEVKIQKFNFVRIGRSATYSLDKGWRAEKYFLIDKTELKETEVDEYIRRGIPVIGYGEQQELIIECENEKDILHLLGLFTKYSNFYETDPRTGNFVYPTKSKIKKNRKINSVETWGEAWEIPVIIVKSNQNEVPTCKRITKVVLGGFFQKPNIFIGNNLDKTYRKNALLVPSFEDYLDGFNVNYGKEKDYFCNKVFFDWLNKIKWKSVEYTMGQLRNQS